MGQWVRRVYCWSRGGHRWRHVGLRVVVVDHQLECRVVQRCRRCQVEMGVVSA